MNTPCIIWPFAKDKDGYGVVQFGKRQWRVHRLVWAIAKGYIPSSTFVLHECDNPGCFNLRHLFLGDARSNRLDCKRKGRMNIARGEKRHNAILTKEKVNHILYNYAFRVPGRTAVDLARHLGVTKAAVYGVVSGRTWKHHPDEKL